MNLPILVLQYNNIDQEQFINFWSKYYLDSPKEILYTDRINNSKFSKGDIEKLFEWKNGMKINDHIMKRTSVGRIVSKLSICNDLKSNFNMSVFESNFQGISAVWRLFLLHIIQPTRFPIFDQHVYRAHFFLENGIIQEIKESNQFKWDYYHRVYTPYFEILKTHTLDLRKIDMALWAFGKFLKTTYAEELV